MTGWHEGTDDEGREQKVWIPSPAAEQSKAAQRQREVEAQRAERRRDKK